jgi:hypothetical protein
MQEQAAPRTHRADRTAHWLDAALELVIAAALLAAFSPIAGWFDIAAGWVMGIGLVFAAAALAIGLLARSPNTSDSTVRALIMGNVAGGTAGWAILLFAWTSIDIEGRWLLGAASDSFILIAVLEMVALRRSLRG